MKTRDEKTKEIGITENLIRLEALKILSRSHDQLKSRIKREHFHGVDITQIEIENNERKWNLTIKRVTGKKLSGEMCTEIFFDFPGVELTGMLRTECERYSKLVAV